MGKDYYNILQIKDDATDADIKKAYRILALKFHPLKNPGDLNAAEKFLLIAEAYDILIDGRKRATYDQFGEEGLRYGVPEGTYPAGAWTNGYVFHGDPEKVFRDFFGSENPYREFYDRVDGDMHLGFGGLGGRGVQKQDLPIEKDLLLSLEELFFGCIKKMKISRRVMNDDGLTTTVRDKILSINVKRGWKPGTRVTFPQEGDQGPNNIPADIVFVVKDKPHLRFSRLGLDLVLKKKLTLTEALTGCVMEINTIDEKLLHIPINEIVSPGFKKVVAGEGMPDVDDPNKRGNLIIDFDIEFPKFLSPENRVLVKKVLGQSN